MARTEIQEISIYRLNGKEYRSIKEIRTEAENCIGGIIDSTQPHIPAKQALQLIEVLTKKENREKLVWWLSITIERDIPYAHGLQSAESVNIFDL